MSNNVTIFRNIKDTSTPFFKDMASILDRIKDNASVEKVFLIEFDNTQNKANHIHTVWRDFNGDFGRDLITWGERFDVNKKRGIE